MKNNLLGATAATNLEDLLCKNDLRNIQNEIMSFVGRNAYI